MFLTRVNKGIFPALESALNVPVGGTDNFSALEDPLITPVAVNGRFIAQPGNNAQNAQNVIYDGTLLTYFLWKNGGDPDRVIEFLEINKTTAWDLQSGTQVVVPLVGASGESFPLHSEA